LIGEHRPDLIVEDTVVVEIKRVERMEPVHIAQMVTYLRITELKVGLIINFNCATPRSGIRRVLK
jgi:GxxExxY protein